MEKRIADLMLETLQGDYDSDLPWIAVRKLQQLGTQEVFDSAAEFCRASDPLRRSRGADILGQIGSTFYVARFAILSNMLSHEQETRPLASAIYALGHLRNPAGIELLREFARHASVDVRHATAFALGCFADNPEAAEALMELMDDADADVRDWATFGLGILGSLDGERIRSALLARLTDQDENVREEAVRAWPSGRSRVLSR